MDPKNKRQPKKKKIIVRTISIILDKTDNSHMIYTKPNNGTEHIPTSDKSTNT